MGGWMDERCFYCLISVFKIHLSIPYQNNILCHPVQDYSQVETHKGICDAHLILHSATKNRTGFFGSDPKTRLIEHQILSCDTGL